MIKGIGLDIVEINRIEAVSKRQNKLPFRVLTEAEREIYFALGEIRKVEFLAGRFAAKEAYAKARGTGIGSQLSFLDIEILPDTLGKPQIRKPLFGKAHLSITHTEQYAAAQVIIED
ncbi:holo-ACP synthase [Lederbergia galactosidilytica]|uniref:Holo-[acyl-carrier-protein] synthase n=1 Tax=Lederbergia galactosidilytica TaxID=217031 RepID=A0A0Q9XXA4_9BACI|nr:holo-ACP synthase [Lederbergia galactosidilytica]KRG09410.1 4'-phosphopantetheinyl transferase [Lederbergia galactosidilytica]KRG16210.1 4'-phosphopantetheinyl transferase [Virgibacillus soli]MBP1914090.1 holo-[acyl-carrier protein] synthase [Lederbergia galactosidilytica]OAK75643.1 4'-phosphopantetheinyl transferase [Lederbergia galactosidilytica]